MDINIKAKIELIFKIKSMFAFNFIKSLPGFSYIALAARNYIKVSKGAKFLSFKELLEQQRI